MQGYHEKFTDRETLTYNKKVAKRISKTKLFLMKKRSLVTKRWQMVEIMMMKRNISTNEYLPQNKIKEKDAEYLDE